MRADAGGFSLLEVLGALAVLALAMGALVRTAGLRVAALEDARERTCARWVAANAIAESRLAGGGPAAGETREGESRMGRERWRWRMSTAATPLQGVARIDVAVSSARGRIVLTLSGFQGAVE